MYRVLNLLLLAIAATVHGQQPNFVIIIADDMGWNDAGCYGHPHIRTPSIDRLAKQGMRFNQAYLTTSSCSPSRSSLITGRYPHSTGAGELHQPLPDNQTTVAGVLRRAGYYTAAAGKWHLGEHAKRAFDTINQGRPSGCEEWVSTLRERPKDKPFFLWLAAFDPHRPYAEDSIAEPHVETDAVVPPYLPDNEITRADLADYYDEIARMDGYIGLVMEELNEQGVSEETMVVFLSDNGRPFPRCKTTLYDSGVKTPFIVRFPERVKPDTQCGALISAVDLAPTLLALAGAEVPKTMQGHSFQSLLAHPTARIREFAFSEHNWHDYSARERSVRDGRWLYIRDEYRELPLTPPADAVRSPTYQEMIRLHDSGALKPGQMATFVAPRPTEELYDTHADPYSLNNLAKVAEHTGELRRLRRSLDEWQKRTRDRAPQERRQDEFNRRSGERLHGKK